MDEIAQRRAGLSAALFVLHHKEVRVDAADHVDAEFILRRGGLVDHRLQAGVARVLVLVAGDHLRVAARLHGQGVADVLPAAGLVVEDEIGLLNVGGDRVVRLGNQLRAARQRVDVQRQLPRGGGGRDGGNDEREHQRERQNDSEQL